MPSKLALAITKTVEGLEKGKKVQAAVASVTKTLTEAHRLASLKLTKKP